ncbi:MAG: shikimate kinase [Xanthomonadales bacterium]|nr:shikimate kinase [Xanthomonadales bacterium]
MTSLTERIIFLVGPMGSGKTTIGRLVAAELGLQFHDCDQELEQRTGASVNLIFDVEGEAGFRKRETQLLRRLSRKTGVLIATGGGVVTRKANRNILQSTGLVIWLNTTVEQQLRRLSHDKSRPLLQTTDREARLNKLAVERNALYRAVSDIEFKSPNQNSRLAALKLAALIRDYWRSDGSSVVKHAGR